MLQSAPNLNICYYPSVYLAIEIKPPAVVKAIALIGSGTTIGEAMVETNMQATTAR